MKNIFKQDTIKYSLFVLIIFFASTLILTVATSGYDRFSLSYEGPFAFMKIKEVGIDKIWPNVLTTVAELNPASLDSIISQIGIASAPVPTLLFLLALIGIIFTLIRHDKNDKAEIYYFILSAVWFIIVIAAKPSDLIVFLVLISIPIIAKIGIAIYRKESGIDFKLAIISFLWFASTIYASTKGVRFMLLLVPAFAIVVGIAFGFIYKYTSQYLSKNLYLNNALSKAIVILLLLLLMVNPVKNAVAISKASLPLINDAWYDSLVKISTDSKPDSIINSWWDYGHWFKAVGDRATTFDGTSQDSPMAHWIGHVLVNDNETDAIGVLRMLDCGSNTAFDKLNEQVKDEDKSQEIIHEIVSMDKTGAKNYLLKFISDSAADEVLKYTHCTPPDDYFITSEDMIGKSGVWAHFGLWDFDKAYIYNVLNKNEYSKR